MNSENEDNSGLKNSEKEARRFSLKLVFIIIVALAVVVFILQFRVAKRVVEENHKKNNVTRSMTKPDKELVSGKLLKPIENRGPTNQAHSIKPLKRRPLQRGAKGRMRFHSLKRFKVSTKTIELEQGKSYQELLDYVAVSAEYRERFDPSSIVEEKFRRIFVEKQEATGLKSQGLVRNVRTGILGVVTGTLVVKFQTNTSFAQRSELLPPGFKEQRSFDGIKTVIWLSDSSRSLSELELINSNLVKANGVKSSIIEILEHTDISK